MIGVVIELGGGRSARHRVCDPGSELRKGRSGRSRAKIISGTRKKLCFIASATNACNERTRGVLL